VPQLAIAPFTGAAFFDGYHQKMTQRVKRATSSLLFFHFKEERACHPERSARNAREAKDLLSMAIIKKQVLRAFGPQDDKRVRLREGK